MRTVILATVLMASATAFADEGAILELSAGTDVETFIAEVLEFEAAQGLERSTESSLRQVFSALDTNGDLVLDEAEISVFTVDPGY